MNTWIRLALAASLTLAAAPAAMAQCVVNPDTVGSRCTDGSRPIVNGHSTRPHMRITPPPQPAPFRSMSVPAPRQAQTMGAPNTSPFPNTSLPGRL